MLKCLLLKWNYDLDVYCQHFEGVIQKRLAENSFSYRSLIGYVY